MLKPYQQLAIQGLVDDGFTPQEICDLETLEVYPPTSTAPAYWQPDRYDPPRRTISDGTWEMLRECITRRPDKGTRFVFQVGWWVLSRRITRTEILGCCPGLPRDKSVIPITRGSRRR